MDMRPFKKALTFVLIMMMMVLLAACETIDGQKLQEMPTVLGELTKLEGEEGNWLGLTAEEKLADFDTLYQTLEENYPYFGVLERKHGVDLAQVYQEMRPKVAESTSDAAFFAQLELFTRSAQMVGHLGLITPMDYDWYAQGYKNHEGIPEEAWPQMERLAQAYGNAQSQASYQALGEIFWPVMANVQAFYAQESKDEQTDEEQEASANVETRIIEPGRIAYIAINSFDMSCYTEDKETLFAFYEKVRDYPHVIIDLTNNGGGGMSYFDDLLAAPNITEPLSCPVYALAKSGANNQAFLDMTDFQPVSQLPDLPRLNADDRQELDVFQAETYTVEPLSADKLLQGRLWLLVGPRVFSSSEYAAMFTKATGLATLVGETTSGDGIGEDPLPIILPHSGLIVRYSAIYGTTADGAASQEYGTEPDIYAANGESALDACLRAIKEADTAPTDAGQQE